MRFAVVKEVYNAGLENPNICFITGDYGHANTEEFRRNFVGRYFNAGMSEQNIIGMAAGMALEGMKVFVYSIVPFITLRCYEQIKIDVCEHNLDVTIIGGGGGFAYGDAGPTHYSIEDIGAMRLLPNMKVVCPANPMEASQLMRQLIAIGGPAYVRIGRGKEANPPNEYRVEFGKAAVLREGKDVTIIATGQIVSEALRAAELLAAKGIEVEVLNMHTVKPLDISALRERAAIRRLIVTLEEHSILGGLGGAVAEVLAEVGGLSRFKRFGVVDAWPEVVGSQNYLRDLTGISAEKIVPQIMDLLKQV
jgi:transketolase